VRVLYFAHGWGEGWGQSVIWPLSPFGQFRVDCRPQPWTARQRRSANSRILPARRSGAARRLEV